MIKSTFLKKATLPLALSIPLLTGGCATMDGGRGMYTMGGAGIGAAAGALLGDGRSTSTNGALVIGGAAAGALIGSQFEPPCVNETNTRLHRTINGNRTGEWRGDQTYSENCIGRGGQNIPGANLPPSVQTRGFTK